jgi:polyisoprenoid-binding protein YceI
MRQLLRAVLLCGTLFCSAFVLCSSSAVAEEVSVWDLPQPLNVKNTTLQFDVDTTWHVVTGKIEKVSGEVRLLDAENPLSVQAEIHIPVKSMKTGWGMRDDSLYEHMAAEKFEEVVIRIKEARGECPLDGLASSTCQVKLLASLSICDVTKDIELDAVIEKKADGFVVSGKRELNWAEYNVEDPSIIMAKVDPTVLVSYSVKLPAKSGSGL